MVMIPTNPKGIRREQRNYSRERELFLLSFLHRRIHCMQQELLDLLGICSMNWITQKINGENFNTSNHSLILMVTRFTKYRKQNTDTTSLLNFRMGRKHSIENLMRGAKRSLNLIMTVQLPTIHLLSEYRRRLMHSPTNLSVINPRLLRLLSRRKIRRIFLEHSLGLEDNPMLVTTRSIKKVNRIRNNLFDQCIVKDMTRKIKLKYPSPKIKSHRFPVNIPLPVVEINPYEFGADIPLPRFYVNNEPVVVRVAQKNAMIQAPKQKVKKLNPAFANALKAMKKKASKLEKYYYE